MEPKNGYENNLLPGESPGGFDGEGGLCVGIAQSLGGDNFKGKCLLEVRTGGQGERANDLKAAASGFLDKNQP